MNTFKVKTLALEYAYAMLTEGNADFLSKFGIEMESGRKFNCDDLIAVAKQIEEYILK